MEACWPCSEGGGQRVMLTEVMLGEAPRPLLSISRRVSDVVAEPVNWFWKDRFALGKLATLAGPPGASKTTLALALAAAATNGGKLPDGQRAPLGSVVFIGCEDGVADTIRPRLEAAGADLTKVRVLDWAIAENKKGQPAQRHFDVGEHGAALEELCDYLGDVVLIVIDPITAHCGKTDTHVAGEVRVALTPLQTTAERIGACVLMITHLNKGGGTDNSAMSRVTGSGAFVAVSRSAWLVGLDPGDPDRRRTILAPIKNNLSACKTAIAYTVEPCELAGGIRTSRLKFEPAPVQITADQLVQHVTAGSADRKTQFEGACTFLCEELKSGRVSSKDLDRAAKDAGIAIATLKRAKSKLGVIAKKTAHGWAVELPEPQRRQEAQGDQEYQEYK